MATVRDADGKMMVSLAEVHLCPDAAVVESAGEVFDGGCCRYSATFKCWKSGGQHLLCSYSQELVRKCLPRLLVATILLEAFEGARVHGVFLGHRGASGFTSNCP